MVRAPASPRVPRRETVITSLTGDQAQLQRESLIDEKKRQIQARPRYIRGDLVFPDRSKINQWISYTGSREMCTRFSFWHVPVSTHFQGITATRTWFMIY